MHYVVIWRWILFSFFSFLFWNRISLYERMKVKFIFFSKESKMTPFFPFCFITKFCSFCFIFLSSLLLFFFFPFFTPVVLFFLSFCSLSFLYYYFFIFPFDFCFSLLNRWMERSKIIIWLLTWLNEKLDLMILHFDLSMRMMDIRDAMTYLWLLGSPNTSLNKLDKGWSPRWESTTVIVRNSNRPYGYGSL